MLTVDCGITGVAEVELARSLGLEIVVTDHHRPGDSFPACPVVAPLKGDYPFTGLCGTGVVEARPGAARGRSSVPRAAPRRGRAGHGGRCRPARRRESRARPQRPAQARADAEGRPAGSDARGRGRSGRGRRDLDRLPARTAHRAGRLGTPEDEAALELLLTEDRPRPRAYLAEELERLNRERQGVEERILANAVKEIESWPEEQRRLKDVVAGADWHEGVIGIVASRLVEHYNQPIVLIAGTEGDWKGSGRSRSAPSTCTPASAPAPVPRALRRTPCRGGALDQARTARRLRPGLRRLCRFAARGRRSRRLDEGRCGRARAEADARPVHRAGSAGAVRACNPGVLLLVDEV